MITKNHQNSSWSQRYYGNTSYLMNSIFSQKMDFLKWINFRGLDGQSCDVQDTLVVIIVPQIFICLYLPYLRKLSRPWFSKKETQNASTQITSTGDHSVNSTWTRCTSMSGGLGNRSQ